MGFFIYKQYLYYMKLNITESQYKLLVEQNWKKRLLSALTDGKYGSDVLTKSVVQTLKKIDVKISNKFLNYKVSNIGDMVKYLDEFESIWKSSLGEQGFKNFKQTMVSLNDPNFVKRVNDIFEESQKKGEQLYFLMKRNIPEETHEIFDEMLPAAMANKNLSSSVIVTNPKVTLVKDTKTNTNVVKTNVGDKEYFLPLDDTQKTPINNEPKIDISLKSPQVVGKKLNISDSDIKKITDNFEKWKSGDSYGTWPFDNKGKKDYVEITINGTPTKITYGKYGPYKLSQKGAKELPSEVEKEILNDFIKNYPDEGISWENLAPLYTDVNKNYKVQNKYSRFKVNKLQEMGYGTKSGYFDRTILGDNVKGIQTNIDGEQWVIINSNLVKNPDEIKFTLTHELTHVNQESWLHDIRRFFSGGKGTYKNPNVLEVVNKKVKARTYRYFLLNGPSFDMVKLERLKEMGKITDSQFEKYKTIKNKLENLEWSDDEVIKFAENNADIYRESFNNSKFHLNYLSNIVEIEPNFVASIRDIIQKSTTKGRGEGLATFLGESLRKGDFSSSETIQKYADFGLSKDTALFLSQLEGPIGAVNPKLQKKLKNDLYKQIGSLIKNGFPALIPFFLGNAISDDKNESIKNFNKLIITESQYKLLKEFKKKAYSFDWDDNILVMPTRIHLDYNVNSNDIADLGSEGNTMWVPVSVSTEQFRSIRHKLGKEFRYPNDDILSAFKDFRDYDAFIEDTKRALSNRSYGPSFDKFKEALISGSDFSIITARSNPPKAIKEGIKAIIRDMGWVKEKEMEKNLNGLTIDEYLNLQDYHPVSSEEFAQRFGLESVGTSPEEGKKIAFKSFVDRIVSQISKIKDDEDFEGISVGFSDDDEGNVEVIEDLIRDELKRLYPEITFTVYDTSDPKDTKKKRIIIKK